MTTALTSFLPLVLPYATLCPEPLAIQALREAAREFCCHTNLVQRVQQHNVVAGTAEYTPNSTTSMLVAKIMKVWHLGTELTFVDQMDDPTALVGADIDGIQLQEGTPTHWFVKTPAQQGTAVAKFVLYPVPVTAVTSGVTIRISLEPTSAAEGVEEMLYDHWREDIAAGALARIMSVANQPYTSPTEAKRYRKVFDDAVRVAKWETLIGHGVASLRVKPRRFV